MARAPGKSINSWGRMCAELALYFTACHGNGGSCRRSCRRFSRSGCCRHGDQHTCTPCPLLCRAGCGTVAGKTAVAGSSSVAAGAAAAVVAAAAASTLQVGEVEELAVQFPHY